MYLAFGVSRRLPRESDPLKSANLFSPALFWFFSLVFTAESVSSSSRLLSLACFSWPVNNTFFVNMYKYANNSFFLFSGPYKVNRVPIRRVHQHFVIATSTKLNIDKVAIPATIDDAYFRRQRQRRAKKAEGDIFAKKKKTYRPSAARKADQITVDKQLLESIKSHPERKVLLGYLKARFGLSTGQLPHAMKFWSTFRRRVCYAETVNKGWDCYLCSLFYLDLGH